MIKDAKLSPCGKYRYQLTRQWSIQTSSMNLSHVVFVMLNPSIADDKIDDQTIRKCIGFSTTWGYAMFRAVNVVAYRATKPKDIPKDGSAEGLDNVYWIEETIRQGSIIVAAWGNKIKRLSRHYEIAESIIHRVSTNNNIPVMCLGLNQDGSPKHPLMPSYNTQLQTFPTYR